ncbi:hypothetical protein XaC1_443 [Xanthomonas phage XaC1]|nr:hypothetical protein XaC1_443 [Xanthomonas phage XaC1]
MLRSQLEVDFPKFKDRLFYTKQEALDSGLSGTVYIGSPAVHSVCEINTREVRGSTEVVKVINYTWTRTYWD